MLDFMVYLNCRHDIHREGLEVIVTDWPQCVPENTEYSLLDAGIRSTPTPGVASTVCSASMSAAGGEKSRCVLLSQGTEASRSVLSDDETLTALARRFDPQHLKICRTQDTPELPELIPNTGPDNGGIGDIPLTNNAFVNAARLSRIAYV
jgi:hypothetical protein